MDPKIKRRKFIRTVPLTVVGTMTCPYVSGKTMEPTHEVWPVSMNPSAAKISAKEEKMEKKIQYIEVKVAKGKCGIHKVGDIARITEQGIDGKICIHALYSLLPAAFAMLYEARFPWLTDNPDKKTHACPDAANPVVFEITRIREI
jgi:uncharacterized repeat protein (TIGR04076 family)